MKYEIKNRFDGSIIYQDEAESFSALVEAVIKNYANLLDANLEGANLRDANLEGANLEGANLEGANLLGANLLGANLLDANLEGANLLGANLQGANLLDANLLGANLEDANLRGANLRGANLEGANLLGANLEGADLTNTYLPAPTILLLAIWREVSETLTADLMLLDSSAHPDPEAFKRWTEGGPCPYQNVKVQRIANFKERKDLWGKGKPDTIYNLMVRVLREKTKTDL
jgi:hypothetical protein